MKWFLFFIAVFSLFPFSSYGERIIIAGRVRDQENKPVEFATVRLKDSAIGTTTDIEGKYSLSVASQDTLTLIFSSVGYKTAERSILTPKADVVLNVKLYPAEKELKELEVTGFRDNINGMQTFNAEQFKISPDVSGGSVESILATMPGVNSNNELSSQYSVRGGSYDENSVYINGIEIYRPQLMRNGQQEGLSVINPDMVGNVRFSSGGFPARYSDKMSSALDITYRDPEAFEGCVTAGLTGGAVAIGVNSGKFSMLHGVRLKKNNSVLSSLETKGEYDPLYFDYQVNLNLKCSEKFSMNFLGNIAVNDFQFKPSDRETTFGTAQDAKKFKVYFDGREKDRFDTYFGALSAKYNLSKATTYTLTVGGFMTNELVSYDISGEYWLDKAGTSGSDGIGGELGVGKYMEHNRTRLKASVLSAALRGTSRLGRNNLTYGVQWSHETLRDRAKEWEWQDSAGYSLPTAPDGVHLIYNLSSRNEVKSNRFALFAEDALYLESEKAFVTLNFGARVSYWNFNKEILISPRLNLSISPIANRNLTYRIGGGLYYQSPFYKEYREEVYDDLGNGAVVLNRDIKSPRSIQAVGGVDYTFRSFGRPFKLTGEFYYKNLHNLIPYEYDNLKVRYTGRNEGSGYAAGIDMKLFGQFVPGSDSWLSFSLMKTEQKVNGVKTPLPSDQRYSVGLFFTDYFPKFPKLKFSLRGIFSDGLTMTPPRTDRWNTFFRAPAYKRIDIGFSYDFLGSEKEGNVKRDAWRHFKSITLGVDLFNLFDISNVSSYYWVTDVNNLQYAVPNYLTRRQVNVRLSIGF